MVRRIKALNEGRESLAEVARPGRPSVSDEQVQAVAALLDTDRRQTIRELGQEIGLSHTTVMYILNNRLRTRKIVSRWVS